MHIILTGALGQVGQAVTSLKQTQHKIQAFPRSSLDITCQNSVENLPTPDIVINAAAYTAVDKAETEPNQAYDINQQGPTILARFCATRNIPLIHISTDYVFNGSASKPYQEDVPVNPINIYGKSKAAGEQAVREQCEKHIILRTSWVFSDTGSNFVKTILRLSHEKDRLNIVSDQQGSPTSAYSIAEAVLTIANTVKSENLNSGLWGTYHYSGSPLTNWYEFAREIITQSSDSIESPVELNPISTKDYPTPAARPLYSALDCSKIYTAFNIQQPSWRTDLNHVLKSLRSKESVV